MYHYIYLLSFPNLMLYIGCRSSRVKPKLDTLYLGSGRSLPFRSKFNCRKDILKTFDTREEAISAEIQYIIDNDCVNSINYYNMKIATYDRHGDEGTPTNIGRTKHTHEYIRKANIKRSTYTGINRTPAQQAADEKATGKSTGPCKAKGRPGINNSGFSPWYYITPEGEYYEVYDVPKQNFAETINVTARQLGHRFHYTNEHRPGKAKPLKGWIFGNLPRPTKTGAD